MKTRKVPSGAAALCLLLLLAACPVFAGAVRVDKVDPPSWFTDLEMKGVMLLLQGENLAGCAVSADPSGSASAEVLGASANGHYLFVELTLSPKAAPGGVDLVLAKGGATTRVAFPLLRSCKGRHLPAGFSARDVIYLVMPDRFADGNPDNNVQPSNRAESRRDDLKGWHGGDFAGVSRHLEYLRNLGLTAVWLTPVCENAGPVSYHGYHATDFYRPDPHFGTMDEFRAMVDKAHAMGLKVIQDQVVNHTGPEHPWVADPPTPTWFNGTPGRHLSCDWNIPGLASPHASTVSQDATVRGWFAGILPDLNGDDPRLVRYFTQNSIWWVALTGIDGIRLDTYPYMAYGFWKQWFPPLRKEFPDLRVVGEVMEWVPSHIAYWQKGFPKTDGTAEGPESVMDFCTMTALRGVYAEKASWKPIRDLYMLDYLYPAPESVFTILDNHDTVRFATAVGSRGAVYRNALALNLLLRGIPQIYSGGEFAMEGNTDPENRKDFPGGFPGDTVSAFTGKGLGPDEKACLEWTRKVLGVRGKCDALQTGTFTELFADGDVLLVRKVGAQTEAVLLFHRGAAAREFAWGVSAFPGLKGEWTDVLRRGEELVVGDELRCALAPFDVRVWVRPVQPSAGGGKPE
ncbi:MAG: cyclomaltodextrinase N-terminal domain-containing protein [Acidobacteria bacterium]|nr:cyclomaltodextrinase N-terminal domain-containing protein [Acidobacteriota bacterium]